MEKDYATFSMNDDDSDSNSDGSRSEEDKGEEEVTFEDFVPIQHIASGGFGKVKFCLLLQVFLVKNKKDGKFYAVKRIRKDSIFHEYNLVRTL